MTVILEDYTFDPARTSVKERLAEVGGTDERIIEINGILAGFPSTDAIEAELDAILQRASKEDYSAVLSLRTGRRFFVRREAFHREIAPAAGTGAFTLTLTARDTTEEAITPRTHTWTLDTPQASLSLDTAGTAPARLVARLCPQDAITAPALGDGVHTLSWPGIVNAGACLEINGETRTVLLDGETVTSFTTGEFPRVVPPQTTLSYSDASGSARPLEMVLSWRDRWW